MRILPSRTERAISSSAANTRSASACSASCLEQEPVRPLGQRPAELDENLSRIRFLGKDVGLINHRAQGLAARNDVGIGALICSVAPISMRDAPEVILAVKNRGQSRI